VAAARPAKERQREIVAPVALRTLDRARCCGTLRTVNDTEQLILDEIRKWVWSGYYSPEEVGERIADNLEDGVDEARLRAAVPVEFAKKQASEATWPEVTDCDRLDRAFAELEQHGIVALQNAGYTMSDGLDDVADARTERGLDHCTGYCFFHEQDLERALVGDGLMLAFGTFTPDESHRNQVAQRIRSVLQQHGFVAEWSGDPMQRIRVPKITWQRRQARPQLPPDTPRAEPRQTEPPRPWWRFW